MLKRNLYEALKNVFINKIVFNYNAKFRSFKKRWYGFSVFVTSINLFSSSLYLSPRECQFGLRYAVMFMTSRSCWAGINESCWITLTLVVLRTWTRFLCITTRKREHIYLKLLFHLAVHFITFRVFPQMHAVSVSRRNLFIGYRFFYCDAVRGYATFVYSTSLQPCTSCNLFQGKKMRSFS